MNKVATVLFLLIGHAVSGQSVLEQKLDGSEKGKKLTTVITEWEEKSDIRFYYRDEWLSNVTVDESYAGKTLLDALNDMFSGTDVSIVSFGEHDVVFIKDQSQAIERNKLFAQAARERKTIEKLVIGSPQESKKGSSVYFRGRVLDSKSKEALVGTSVTVSNVNIGTTTDGDGRFEIKLPAGQHVATFSYVNFEAKIIDLQIYRDGTVDIELQEEAKLLDEITISDAAIRENTTGRAGQSQLSIRELKRSPSMLGEVDLIRQVQVLPGVTTAGEAASGFNVRGGGVDQNLVLYDGIPVFNSSHAFGFFSAFNSQAIRDVSFYRGGIPAEYGGRISSVLDIRSKEGDYEKWSGSGGIGMISSNLMLSGPVSKDKTSVAASFRTTYSDWLINSIKTNYVNLENSSVTFYDGTFKAAHKFNGNTKLTVSAYASNDQFRLKGDSSYRWRNFAASARIDHQYSSSFGANVTIGTGSYSYDVVDKNPFNGFNLSYSITYPSIKAEFHYQNGLHKMTFGGQSTFYSFNPGTLTATSSSSSIKNTAMESQRSLENAVFFGDGFNLNEKYFIEAGLRLSSFTSYGPSTLSLYEPGIPREISTQTATQQFASGESIKTYFGIEPRLSARYTLTPASSIKAGYNRTYQYLHLVTNTTAITPIDIWIPSGYYFKPQYADQLSLGYFKNLKENKYELSVEGYYKLINNIIDFKDGAKLILNTHLETDLLQGEGRAYGIEASINKITGRLTGSLNYTFSRSFRTIKGQTDRESVNNGREYASNFDQPNIVNVSWKYNISRRYFLTGNFTYHTGRPVTVPQSAFVIDNVLVTNFSDRNQYRIPDYHRLDIALILEGNHRRKKFWDGTWALSIYNVYGRKNPYTIFFSDAANKSLQSYQLSIIGTALPSISYSFKF